MDAELVAVRNQAYFHTHRTPFPDRNHNHIPDCTMDTVRMLQVLVGSQSAHILRGPFLVPVRIHLHHDSHN